MEQQIRRRRRRTPKPPLADWIVTNREAQPTPDGKGWTSDELADRVGVARSTVRGWEIGRPVSLPNLAALERLFGKTAPGEAGPPDQSDLAAAIREQTTMLSEVLHAILERLPPAPPPEVRAGLAIAERLAESNTTIPPQEGDPARPASDKAKGRRQAGQGA